MDRAAILTRQAGTVGQRLLVVTPRRSELTYEKPMSKPLNSRAINATVSPNDEVLIPKSENIERVPRESVDAMRGFLQGPKASNAKTTGCNQPPLTHLRSELRAKGRAAIR